MATSPRRRAGRGDDDGDRRRRRVQVVVLGDFGRSPRMQYHALSLASQANMTVDVVAYEGSTPRGDVLNHPHISLRLVAPPPRWLQRFLPRMLALAVRVLLQIWQLSFLMMARLQKPDFILLQTPPCIPSFTVCRLTAWLRGAKFVIDWHNFAYTLMALKHGARHPAVRLSQEIPTPLQPSTSGPRPPCPESLYFGFFTVLVCYRDRGLFVEKNELKR